MFLVSFFIETPQTQLFVFWVTSVIFLSFDALHDNSPLTSLDSFLNHPVDVNVPKHVRKNGCLSNNLFSIQPKDVTTNES